MALNDAPGTYWYNLAQDQQAGTFWKCPCGEFNPGTYDTCHFCQRAQPTPEPPVTAGTVFTPTSNDMEGCFDGILVASLGEDGEVIAVTGDKRAALEAIDTYYRKVCGQPNLLDDATARLTDAYYALDSGHGVFTRTADGGWNVTPTAEDAPGAVAVTWFRGAPVESLPEPYARRNDPSIW